jgi:NAD(P)-dependent dehydrogenase (short-subunit alcohol dehydrogenase family)
MPDSRFIVITGASRGLGRAMTDGFISAGQTVVGCARSNEAVAELGKHFGPPHRFEAVDVSDHQQVKKWTASILEEFGPPDILINSAAVINNNAPLWQVSPDEFSRIVDINIKGVHNTIYHLVPSMIQRGSGVIVNFSSYWGRSTSSDVAAYCTTKWAIEGLSRGLADDLPIGMASVAFNPGVVHTDMLESCFAEGAASYPSPQQWAEAAVPYILELGPEDNGQAVTVPGF